MRPDKATDVERWMIALQGEHDSGDTANARLFYAAREMWGALKDLPDSDYLDLAACRFSDTLAAALVAARQPRILP